MTDNKLSTLETLQPFIEAQLSASHSATNRVIEDLEMDVEDWKRRFANLFDLIEGANQTVDSLKIDNILARASQHRCWADQATETEVK